MKLYALAATSIVLLLSAGVAKAEDFRRAHLHEVMNSVFGPGAWRETGGYRTPARENELRAQGALTVPEGVLSRHSLGGPDAPGAYDVVVDGLSPGQAADRLRQAGADFRTLFPEGAHGTQGPHLHLEPNGFGSGPARRKTAGVQWTVAKSTPAQQELDRLHLLASAGDAQAQLRLGEVYSAGRDPPRDLIASYIWAATAAANPAADPATRDRAGRGLATLGKRMSSADRNQAQDYLRSAPSLTTASACRAASLYVVVPVSLGPDAHAPASRETCMSPVAVVLAADGVSPLR